MNESGSMVRIRFSVQYGHRDPRHLKVYVIPWRIPFSVECTV